MLLRGDERDYSWQPLDLFPFKLKNIAEKAMSKEKEAGSFKPNMHLIMFVGSIR